MARRPPGLAFALYRRRGADPHQHAFLVTPRAGPPFSGNDSMVLLGVGCAFFQRRIGAIFSVSVRTTRRRAVSADVGYIANALGVALGSVLFFAGLITTV